VIACYIAIVAWAMGMHVCEYLTPGCFPGKLNTQTFPVVFYVCTKFET
jgi:hypothetical protein